MNDENKARRKDGSKRVKDPERERERELIMSWKDVNITTSPSDIKLYIMEFEGTLKEDTKN